MTVELQVTSAGVHNWFLERNAVIHVSVKCKVVFVYRRMVVCAVCVQCVQCVQCVCAVCAVCVQCVQCVCSVCSVCSVCAVCAVGV